MYSMSHMRRDKKNLDGSFIIIRLYLFYISSTVESNRKDRLISSSDSVEWY